MYGSQIQCASIWWLLAESPCPEVSGNAQVSSKVVSSIQNWFVCLTHHATMSHNIHVRILSDEVQLQHHPRILRMPGLNAVISRIACLQGRAQSLRFHGKSRMQGLYMWSIYMILCMSGFKVVSSAGILYIQKLHRLRSPRT